jgi:oligosaccharyltransferase complex subunit gamma
VVRPTLLSNPWFYVAFATTIAVLGVAGVRLWKAGVLHHPLPYALGALAVYWFSVSGGMYNIIRGVPFFVRDREGRIQLFGQRR